MPDRLRLLLLILCLPALASAASEGVAVYRGAIDAERNAAFFRDVEGREVERLRITSSGGSVEAGVALARWVHRNGIHVVVEGHCLSSCANYVFPAGARKVIRPGAVVAWHGSYRHLVETGLWRGDVDHRMEAHGEDRDTARRRARAEAERLAALEDAFFAEIGVDPRLCWFAKVAPYHVPDYYTLSVADMARFGVTGVEAPEGYPPADLSGLGWDVTVIRLGAAGQRRRGRVFAARAPARPNRIGFEPPPQRGLRPRARPGAG
jgi:hypothetical protein